MRHLKSGRKLNRTKAHRKALMRNLATALFEHKRINTTEAKAKELRPYAEKIITRAKLAHIKEQNGELPKGQTVDVHARREVAKKIINKGHKKAVLQELFEVIVPKLVDREGGYTRVIKTDFRRGDGGSNALIELVDWAGEQNGIVSSNQMKKQSREERVRKQQEKDAANAPEVAPVEEAAPVEEVAPVEEAVTPTTEEEKKEDDK